MEDARANGPGESFEQYYRGDIVQLTHFVMKLGASYEQGWDVAQEAMKEAMLRWVTIEVPRAYTRRVAAIIYFGQVDAEAAQRTSAQQYVEQRQRALGIGGPALSFTDLSMCWSCWQACRGGSVRSWLFIMTVSRLRRSPS